MDAQNENLSAQQSLDLITSMIRQAKGNLSENAFYFLLWGWTIMICNLGVFVMIKYTDIKEPSMIFMLTIVSAIISAVHGARQSSKAKVSTIIDSANMWLWIGYAVLVFTIIPFGSKINWQINPILISMASVPTFVTGIMLRFKPLMFGGVALWIFGVVLFLVPAPTQFLVAAIAIAIGYLIPGYLLKKEV